MGRFIVKAVNACNEGRRAGFLPTLLMINQYRMKVGLVFGDPRSIPGGKAKDYAISLSLELKKSKEVMGKDSQGREVADHNDHSIEVKKTKIGGSITAGDFTLCRNRDGKFAAGFIDEGETVKGFAKDAGFLGGSAGKYTVDGAIDPSTGEVLIFRTHQDIIDWWYANPVAFETMKTELIRLQRIKCGYTNQWL